MAFIKQLTADITREVKGWLKRDRNLYQTVVLSRDIMRGIHPGDSITLVDSNKISTVTEIDAEIGIVRIGPEEGQYFETNQQVIIGCPGGPQHKLVTLGK